MAEVEVQTKAADHWMSEANKSHNRLAESEAQEPVGYAYGHQDYIGSVIGAKGEWAPNEVPLYTAAGASPQPSVGQNPKFTMGEWMAHARNNRWRFDEEQVIGVGASPVEPKVILELPEGDTRKASVGWVERKGDELHVCISVDDAQPSQAGELSDEEMRNICREYKGNTQRHLREQWDIVTTFARDCIAAINAKEQPNG